MNLSSFNICPDTNFFASHFALSTPSLTLSRKPFWGLRFGLGRTGLGRPRLGGDCLGKGLLGGASVGGGIPGVATLVTCRDSAGGWGRCCLPANIIHILRHSLLAKSIKKVNSLLLLFYCLYWNFFTCSYWRAFWLSGDKLIIWSNHAASR